MPEPGPSQPAATGGADPDAPAANGSTPQPRWRSPLAVALIVLAGIVMVGASVTVWVKRQALNTDRWVDTSSQLLQDDEVRHALSVYIVDAAFEKADAAGELGDRLPPSLQALASPLAASLRGNAVNVTDQILARPGVQNGRAWEEINRIAHELLIKVIDGDRGGDVVLDLSPLVTQVRDRLGLGPPPSPDAGRLVIMRNDQVETLQTAAKTIRKASLLLWLLVIALFAVAIWLARGWRHRAVLITGWTILAVGLLLLAVRRIGGQSIVDALAPQGGAHESADAAWLIATTLLRDLAQAVLALGALIVVGAWVAGGSRWAVALRQRLAPAFRQRPVAVYGSFVLFIILLLLVLPGGSGRRLVGTLVLFALLLAGLEALKRLTLREFPPVPAAPAPALASSPPGPSGGGPAGDGDGPRPG